MQIQRLSANALVVVLALGGSWAVTSQQDTPQISRRTVVEVPSDTEDLVATPIRRPGGVAIGAIIAHALDTPGAAGLEVLREHGFAVCNGTTPAFQGIEDAVMAGPTPDLNDSGRFLRGADPGLTGVMEDDATAVNGLTINVFDNGHDHMTLISDFLNNNNGSDGGFRSTYEFGSFRRAYWVNELTGSSGMYHTRRSFTGIESTASSNDSETRPSNMSVLWIMRVK